MTEAFVIIDIADSDEWPLRFGNSHAIPDAKRPTILNLSRDAVEQEALRLANAYPLGRFCIFEASQVTVAVKVPTHVNFEGKVLNTENAVRLAKLPGEVPF